MTILLDSDVVIENLRGTASIVTTLHQALERENSFFITPITWAEIYAGIRTGEERAVEIFFGATPCISITEEIGKKAGEYLSAFSRSHGVKIADALIAATAFDEELSLFTLNRKHYPMTDIEFYTPPLSKKY